MKKIITACVIVFSITAAIAFFVYKTSHNRSYAESPDGKAQG